jgi:tetratricopeptide (TPR) repeat protein
MKVRIENREKRKKRMESVKSILFSLFFILFSHFSFAQDSIPEKQDLSEEAELKFQQYFFKALSQKTIGNYKKAIENLESCNQLLENDVAVFFEFSKNYLALNKTLLAKEYINRALNKDENNLWMLQHLVKIHQKDRNYKAAIKVQQQIIELHPKERDFLVRLYLYDRQYKAAISLMETLESENLLSSSLKQLKKNIENRYSGKIKKEKSTDISELKKQFETDKSYQILAQILKLSKDNLSELLKYSSEGILLFPAQPNVYLVKGKVLNYQKKYKNALSTLKDGIDFVIEDKMEVDFYKEIAKAYKGLGDVKEENKYQQKANKLKRL